MSVEVITKDDLQQFRIQLLADLKILLIPKSELEKEWLRSNEIKKVLKISAGTLQNLRVAGKIKSAKIGGIHFYRKGDIEKLLGSENNNL